MVDRVALAVESQDQFVGWASYERWPGRNEAEAAFMVDDEFQGRGIATLLLEHLAAIARTRTASSGSPPRCSATTVPCSPCSPRRDGRCSVGSTPASSTSTGNWRPPTSSSTASNDANSGPTRERSPGSCSRVRSPSSERRIDRDSLGTAAVASRPAQRRRARVPRQSGTPHTRRPPLLRIRRRAPRRRLARDHRRSPIRARRHDRRVHRQAHARCHRRHRHRAAGPRREHRHHGARRAITTERTPASSARPAWARPSPRIASRLQAALDRRDPSTRWRSNLDAVRIAGGITAAPSA